MTLKTLKEYYCAKRCVLNVRFSNSNALAMYKNVFNFTVKAVEEKYYADGENGYLMEKVL